MIKLVVLGVSGSIGKQVLQVVRENPNEFEIIGVSVNTSIEGINDLVKEFPSIKLVGVANEEKYLMPNMEVQLDFCKNEFIGIELPTTVEMKVTETEPTIKGATAASGGKPATMETGLVVTVPDFINVGDTLVINTTTGEYKARA